MAAGKLLGAAVFGLGGAVLQYDESRSVQYAQLAAAAYCSAESLNSWSCGENCIDGVSSVHVCTGTATRSFVALWEDHCVLSFQGSHTPTSFIRDLQILREPSPWNGCSDCNVHSGFSHEYGSQAECVRATLSDMGCASVRITGHSLGAAVAGLAAVDLAGSGFQVDEVYTFGMPRTGDDNFAQAAESLLGGKFFRVTHGQDPVPNMVADRFVVDFGYAHVEPEIYYKGHVSEGYETCTERHQSDKCIEVYWNVPKHILLHVNDHLSYMDKATSSDGCASAQLTDFANITQTEVIV